MTFLIKDVAVPISLYAFNSHPWILATHTKPWHSTLRLCRFPALRPTTGLQLPQRGCHCQLVISPTPGLYNELNQGQGLGRLHGASVFTSEAMLLRYQSATHLHSGSQGWGLGTGKEQTSYTTRPTLAFTVSVSPVRGQTSWPRPDSHVNSCS